MTKLYKKKELTATQQKFEARLDELREKKAFEDRLKENQERARRRFEDELNKRGGIAEIQRFIAALTKGRRSKENLFSQLHKRGKSITFDMHGIPIIQKKVENE